MFALDALLQDCASSENSPVENIAQQNSEVNGGANDQNEHLQSTKADNSPLFDTDSTGKSKKKKKDKSRDGDRTESCSKDVQSESDVTAAAGDSLAKKKKKKRKLQEGVVETDMNNASSVRENGDKHAADETEQNGLRDVHPGISGTADDGATKSVTKKKKKKHHENVADSEANIVSSVCENDAEDGAFKDKKSAKKRKHSAQRTDSMNAGNDICKQVKTADGRNFANVHFSWLLLFNFQFVIPFLTCGILVPL